MARHRYLARAPIAEALIDVRASLGDAFEVERVRASLVAIADSYPVQQELQLVRASIAVEAGRPATPSAEYLGLQGFLCKSPDELNIVQFRADGFTFSRLRPYTGWEQLVPDALRLLGIYQEAVRPVIFTRVAVRYINHLAMPLPVPDFSRYLTAPPVTPQGVLPLLSGFLTRLVLEDPATGVTTNLVQALQPSLDAHSLVVLLDIDAYKVSATGFDRSLIESTLGVLREVKNRVFFSSVTDEALRPYE